MQDSVQDGERGRNARWTALLSPAHTEGFLDGLAWCSASSGDLPSVSSLDCIQFSGIMSLQRAWLCLGVAALRPLLEPVSRWPSSVSVHEVRSSRAGGLGRVEGLQ